MGSVSLVCLGPSGAVRSAHLPVKEKVAGSNPVWGASMPARALSGQREQGVAHHTTRGV
jgi:hypothetical protein